MAERAAMRKLLRTLPALGLLGAIAVYAAFRSDMAKADRRLAHRSEVVQTRAGAMEYASVGRGPAVLVIHGAAGGFDQALDMTGALAERGYRVIAPSRFGYLRSPMPPGLTPEMQADAYGDLLDHLGVEQVTIVSISAGAWSGSQFAARRPERCRALILLVPADVLPSGAKMRGGPLAEAMFNSDFAAWAAVRAMPLAAGAMSESMLGTDAAVLKAASPAEAERAREVLDHLLPIRRRADGMQFDIATAADRRPYPLDKIRCPVLAISAEDDAFGTDKRAREIADAVPQGRAIIFPSGGHALVGRYDETMAAVATVLAAPPNAEPVRRLP